MGTSASLVSVHVCTKLGDKEERRDSDLEHARWLAETLPFTDPDKDSDRRDAYIKHRTVLLLILSFISMAADSGTFFFYANVNVHFQTSTKLFPKWYEGKEASH